MNLTLGCEMGLALLGGAATPASALQQAQGRVSKSSGPQAGYNVARMDKGAFPDQLGRLRGHLNVAVCLGSGAALLVECGPRVLLVMTNVGKDRATHGVWSIDEAKMYPLKQEDLTDEPLITLIKRLCLAAGEVWVAYLLQEPAPAGAPAAPKSKTTEPIVVEPEAPAPVVPATKKKAPAATRKRTATLVATDETEAVVIKKQAPESEEAATTAAFE